MLTDAIFGGTISQAEDPRLYKMRAQTKDLGMNSLASALDCGYDVTDQLLQFPAILTSAQ